LDAIPSNNANRTTVFIKKGYYYEKCKTTNKTNVSLIGENPDSVVIAYDDYAGKVSGMSGATAMTLLADATGLYMENITIKNTAGPVGQAPAIKTTGDNMIFKKCRFFGYQDTYYANKNRQYNLDCYVEGAVDFIYGDAQALFDRCTLQAVRDGSIYTAPADAKSFRTIEGTDYSLGLLFNECTLTASAGIKANSCYMGRPWGLPKATSVYVKCVLGNHIAKAGWTTMTTDAEKTAFFAEYLTVNPEGTPVDVSGRVSWSRQLTEQQYLRCYNADSFLYKNGSFWFPKIMTASLEAPTGLLIESDRLSWTAVDEARGYVIYRNGSAIGFSSTPSFTDTISGKLAVNTYVVRAVSAHGNLSAPSPLISTDPSGLLAKTAGSAFMLDKECLITSIPSAIQVYSLTGVLLRQAQAVTRLALDDFDKGVYLIRIKPSQADFYTVKAVIP
jgi:pectinesterase